MFAVGWARQHAPSRFDRELAVFWLVVLRIVADLQGGEPGPFALASIAGNPNRSKRMGWMLNGAGSLPGERVLELGPGSRWSRWTSSRL